MKDLNYTQAIMDVIYLLLSFFVTSQAQSQPNIVFIFIDDLGWNDVGFHGSEIMVLSQGLLGLWISMTD